jgi:hypothetical protein
MRTRAWTRIVLGGAALLLVWAGYVALFGGFSLRVLGVRLSSGDPFRALVAGTVLGAIGLVATTFRLPSNSAGAATVAARCAGALATFTFVLGIVYGSFVAGGADSYGYISQADLWLTGHLVVDEPMARDAHWPGAEWALTPLGYRPGLQRGQVVPMYSPGLPIAMALFKRIAV